MYDPWYDQDSDGDIDIYDIVPAAVAYGTTGDPTRNVTVTNLPLENGTLGVTVHKEQSIQQASVDINIFELAQSGVRHGTFIFPFEPKGSFLNITDLWIMAFGRANYDTHVNISINNELVISNAFFDNPSDAPYSWVRHITNSAYYDTIVPHEINAIRFICSGEIIYLYKLSVCIKYEYLI